MFIGLVVVECGKSKFFCLNMSVFNGVRVGNFVCFLCLEAALVYVSWRNAEIQPWIVEDAKQLRNATEAQKAQQQRCLFQQILGSVKKKLIFLIG
jgi:hypothetical protein